MTVTSTPPGAATACVGAPVTITLTASGPSPRDVSVPGGGCVVFQNNDTVPHWMNSDPHPLHTDCPDLNEPQPIPPGQASPVAHLDFGPPQTIPTIPKSCGFHDHLNPPFGT